MRWTQDTIAAIATPPGEGGIAIIRVSGPDALPIAAQVFRARKKSNATSWAGYTVRYGQFVDPDHGDVTDDGLLTVFRAPHSYTGEDTIELSCHGGRATTLRVLEAALKAGARLAEPGEFTQRAFLNGRMDLAQAEAVADVIRARTESARRLARRQLDGALSQTVTRLKDDLIGILAAIEVTIDFSDEVGELEHAAILTRLTAVRTEIARLLATAEQGRMLREGLRVAIVGRPNVGKSSLLNALLRQERAIVTPVAGTTRDLVEETANINGVPIVFVDTAGLRETEDVVERIGVERAHNAAAQADVILLVLDATEFCPEDAQIARQIVSGNDAPMLLVLNKCDLVPDRRGEQHPALDELRGLRNKGDTTLNYVSVSARTGEGLDTLEAKLIRRDSNKTGDGQEAEAPKAAERDAEGQQPDGRGAVEQEADGGSVVVANARHQTALAAALNSLVEAEQTTRRLLPGDFIALDVRGALDQLGQITGETVTEDIIHRIFRDFCVGK